ncbi:MAG TPA: Hsp20/alpha crystallin family protein [Thermomicrobiales bacterium]|jgi:HSP20 family protein|nr:Hsp20/alpha crystallin family protein [Thermomicrobiales bacterium]HQZ90318.1 Hsp20/alpha crystallin family protein [Thermomicrobiales bacterium]HRA30770.1 Hsp20/alpha crystallin family protein [Thermomicrobiales bacterium]
MYVMRKRGGRNIQRIQYEMEDTFQTMLGSRPVGVRLTPGMLAAWRPPVEVYETDVELVVLAEIGGIANVQVEVSIDDQVLAIRGERAPLHCEERRRIHAMGIAYGPFAADIFVPFAVDHDAIRADYDAGILTIRLPRAAATKIPVKATTLDLETNE